MISVVEEVEEPQIGSVRKVHTRRILQIQGLSLLGSDPFYYSPTSLPRSVETSLGAAVLMRCKHSTFRR